MRHLVTASLVALTCLLAQAALADGEGPAVPIEKAPFHQPQFVQRLIVMDQDGAVDQRSHNDFPNVFRCSW
jgi:hypothetical protein